MKAVGVATVVGVLVAPLALCRPSAETPWPADVPGWGKPLPGFDGKRLTLAK